MRTIEEITAAMTAISDLADDELTDEKLAEFDALETELKQAQKVATVRNKAAEYTTTVIPAGVPARPGPARDEQAEAFTNYLRTGQINGGLVPSNAQTETTTGGGYLVPAGFRTKLTDVMKAFGGIASVAETLTTSDGASLEWPTINDTANTGAIAAINSAPGSGGADLVFGHVTLGAYRFVSTGTSNAPLKVPVELLQDAAFDIEGLVARKLGQRLARLFSGYLGSSGTGSSQPQGLVYGLTGVTMGDGTALDYDSLIDGIHSVDPAYRQNGRWVFNDNTLKLIRKLKDSNGDPLWRPLTSDMGSSPGGGTLLGYPTTIDPAMADFSAASATVNWGAFGDIAEGYIVRRVRDVQVLVNPYSSGSSGQVEYSAWMRADAKQQNTAAYSALSGNAS